MKADELPSTGRRRWWTTIAAALVAVLAAGAGAWLLAGAAPEASHRHVVVDGVPLDEVHPRAAPAGGRRPGVVVAHGFAGSARLMAPFGDTLVAQGYVVVLLDFSGHGANPHPLPDSGTSADASSALQDDLDIALRHLRGLPDVDASRIAVVGHSMGATAVTRYALAHPEIAATVAISLPEATYVRPDRPVHLLLLVGGLEFAGFRAAADSAVAAGGSDRSAVVVPGVEHISILYAPRTHREVVRWLHDSFGESGPTGAMPSPLRRPSAAGLLLFSFLLGIYPIARLVLGGRPSSEPPVRAPQLGRVLAVAIVAALAGIAVAPLVPTMRLPLSIGNFVVGFTAVAGVVLLAGRRWAGVPSPIVTAGPGRRRSAVAAPVLVAYAGLTIAVPLQLGFTHAIPVGVRWWLLAAVWAGFSVLAYGAEKTAGATRFGVLLVSAVAVSVLTGAAVVGLASGFLLLVVPLLAVLMLCQAIWSAVLRGHAAPAWLIAPVGALLVAWPIAVTLPVIG